MAVEQRFANCGAPPHPGGGGTLLVPWGARVVCMRDILIF
jgi:hypothetical protein